MSGIVKGVKKVFKSKVVKVIAIAAAVWFTAGVASAYFSAAAPGLGASMSASAQSMWTTATTGSFVSGADVAIAQAASSGAALGTGATVGAIAPEAAVTATELAPAATSAAAPAAASASVLEPIAAAPLDLTLGGAASGAGAGAAGGAGGVAGAAGKGGVLGWMKANPIPSMILGQAGVGAYSGYLEDKEREREDEYRRSRGLMGYDYYGTNQGIVASNMGATAPRTEEQAVSEPVTTVAGQTPQQVKRPIQRKNLPQLQKQGLVAGQQVI